MLHVHADLVRAAGLQLALHQRNVSKPFYHLPVRDSMFALFAAFRENGHHHAVLGIAAHIANNGTFVFLKVTPRQCPIFAFQVMVKEDLGQTHLRKLILGNHNKARGVLVDTVHQQGLHGRAIWQFLIAKIIIQCIDHRAGIVAESGVYHHAGLLVDDQNIVVFVLYVQGNVFGNNLGIARRIGHQHGNHITGLHLVILSFYLVIHQDATGLGRLLHLVAGGIADKIEQVFVYADDFRPGIHHETKMLVKRILTGAILYFIHIDYRLKIRDYR